MVDCIAVDGIEFEIWVGCMVESWTADVIEIGNVIGIVVPNEQPLTSPKQSKHLFFCWPFLLGIWLSNEILMNLSYRR